MYKYIYIHVYIYVYFIHIYKQKDTLIHYLKREAHLHRGLYAASLNVLCHLGGDSSTQKSASRKISSPFKKQRCDCESSQLIG